MKIMLMKKKTHVNRRGFLRTTLLGAAGSVAATGLVRGNAVLLKKEDLDDKQGFITRKLGKTNIVVPIVSMGVMRADNPGLVKAALDKGIKLLDTAHTYQGGRNEEMLGKLLKDYPRNSYYIATKIKPDGYNKKKGTFTDASKVKTSYMDKFNTSLKRLGLEYVDILYLHAISNREATLYKPILEIMQKLKEEGRTRYLGVSTHSHEPEVIRAAIDSGIYDVVLVAYNFQQSHREDMDKAIEKAVKAGLGVIAMKTMAGGRMNKDKEYPVKAGTALKWALQNPNVTTSIPGFTTFDQLEEDLAVARDVTLSEEEKKELALATRETLYCDGCARCVTQCKKSLPIPDLMRAYMYTYGYRETRKARDLIDELAVTTDACATCDECTVACVKNFAVAGKITDIARLAEVPQEFLT
ncbi:MAG TPA: hypothetical protein ENK25_00795 [Bacteroidetes bacterium]|nr:hypothetical protein [Bacteroidota bacterium]